MPEEVVVGEVTEVHEGRMRTSGPEGAPNMVGTWLPGQVANRGGVLREDTGVPIEAQVVRGMEARNEGREAGRDGRAASRPGEVRGRRLAVVRGTEAKKSMAELMRRYG